MDREPNHICKYSQCKKPYYACNHSDLYTSWRSIACCPEHFQAYLKEVEAARQEEENQKDVNAAWTKKSDTTEESFLGKAKLLFGVVPETEEH